MDDAGLRLVKSARIFLLGGKRALFVIDSTFSPPLLETATSLTGRSQMKHSQMISGLGVLACLTALALHGCSFRPAAETPPSTVVIALIGRTRSDGDAIEPRHGAGRARDAAWDRRHGAGGHGARQRRAGVAGRTTRGPGVADGGPTRRKLERLRPREAARDRTTVPASAYSIRTRR